MALDKVQPLKFESTSTGGDGNDSYTRGSDPQHDYQEIRGLVLCDGSNRDETTVLDRSGDDMRFTDGNNPSPVTLSQLIEQGFARFSNSNIAGGAGWTTLGTIAVSINSAFSFLATIIGRDKTSGDADGWTLRGVCSRATGSVSVLSEIKEILYRADTNWDIRISGSSTTATIDVYPDATNATEWVCLVHATNIGGIDSLGYTGFSRLGTYSSRGNPGVNGRQYFATDSLNGHWVDNGTLWVPMILGMVPGVEPPLASAFTAFNQGSTTLTQLNGALEYVGVNDGNSLTSRGYIISESSSTAYGEIAVALPNQTSTGTTGFPEVGVILRESGTAKSYSYTIYPETASKTSMGLVSWYSNDTTRTSAVAQVLMADGAAPLFLRVRRNGATIYADLSRDRQTWINVDSRSTTSVFTTAPDQVGIVGRGKDSIPYGFIPHFAYGAL